MEMDIRFNGGRWYLRCIECLMDESGTYGALGVLWIICRGIFNSGGSIGKLDELLVWVEI